MRENVFGAVNQQERPRRGGESSETIRQTPLQERQIVQAYLFGAMHDGTVRQSDHRFRIAQKGTGWLKTIQKLVNSVGYKSMSADTQYQTLFLKLDHGIRASEPFSGNG